MFRHFCDVFNKSIAWLFVTYMVFSSRDLLPQSCFWN